MQGMWVRSLVLEVRSYMRGWEWDGGQISLHNTTKDPTTKTRCSQKERKEKRKKLSDLSKEVIA